MSRCMSDPFFLFILAVLTCLSFASLMKPSADECYDHEFSTFNASASIDFPPLSQNITNSTLATWKLNKAVKEVVTPPGNQTVVKQKWWLQGDAGSFNSSAQLPIDGCLIYLQPKPNNTFTGKGLDNSTSQNGCAKIITSACEAALLNAIKSNVTLYSDDDLNGHWTICPKIAHLLWEPPAACTSQSTSYNLDAIPLQPFNNPEFISPSENGCASPIPSPTNSNFSYAFDIFQGSVTRNSFLELILDADFPSTLNDHSVYDNVLQTTDLFLAVTWPTYRTEGQWTPDAQFACTTAEEGVVQGSRTPPPALPPAVNKNGGSGDGKTNLASCERCKHETSWLAFVIGVAVLSVLM